MNFGEIILFVIGTLLFLGGTALVAIFVLAVLGWINGL